MKHLHLRGNTYYYRRRVPLSIHHLATVKVIFRPLSTNRKLAIQLLKQYDNKFDLIDFGIKLKQDITPLMKELNLLASPKQRINIYESYLQSQDTSDKRLSKIQRILSVLKVLLPANISTVNMNTLDTIKHTLSTMPKRSTNKYRTMEIKEVVRIKAKPSERMSTETLNDHLKILNSLIKYCYERDLITKPYSVTMAKKTTSSRNERVALTPDTVKQVISSAKTTELSNAFTLLYLTGLRPSEVSKCKITTIDGIQCFDLTDTSINLKSTSSHRLIPVHRSIKEPEKLLEDFNSMSTQYISRQFKVEKGTLYSLRHSFATELASKGVEPHIISELLGHSHSGMTMGRYVKGLPVQMLKNTIDILSL
jgi:integrase